MNMGTNKRETAKNILQFLLVAGAVVIAASNPRFGSLLLRGAMREYNRKKRFQANRQKFYSAFIYMRKHGLIDIQYDGRQMYFSLTDEGKKKAGKYKINDLKIKKPKKWDGKWHILIFDIEDKQKIKREALRGKIKELHLYQLQKSVWVHPYDLAKPMKLLREFFGLTDQEIRIIIADRVENDKPLRIYFGLN